ncbi:hypothetical protein A9R01_17380 ['Osedax' symbiont bacterium Rs2_46_30_T18]|nr:hypothetical protein A9R01_17380 ['Osedax' symbiont bacterium Rs2_46_30_T18]
MRRRQFNSYLGTLLLSALLPKLGHASVDQYYASASVDGSGQHWLVVFNQLAVEKLRYPLPGRAHQVIKHPTQDWLLVVARRPGEYLLLIDIQSGEKIVQLSPRAGQHFCGHLQISADGRYLYTTENLSASSAGLIAVRELAGGYATVAQFSSGGIGPHQLKLSSAGQQLIVANGGIHTRDRVKLNLQQMRPSLAYIDLTSGQIEQQLVLDQQYSQLSIRHIDVSGDDSVLIAMQYQGERTARVPLVATHSQTDSLRFLEIPDMEYYQLKHYCGSACFDRTGKTVAVSAPKGDKILFWDFHERRYLGSVKVRDGCGLAPGHEANSFVVSSGRGRVYQINPHSQKKSQFLSSKTVQWDNHLARLN